MRTTSLLAAVALMTVAVACDPVTDKLLIENQTHDTMYFAFAFDSIPKVGAFVYSVSPKDSLRPVFTTGGDGAWQATINRESADSALYLIVTGEPTISESLIRRHAYQAFRYTVSQLDSMEWVWRYSGVEDSSL